jgi:hypothetical protein
MESFTPKKGNIVVYVTTQLITASEPSCASIPTHYDYGIIGEITEVTNADSLIVDFGHSDIRSVNVNKIQPLKINSALLMSLGFNFLNNNDIRMMKSGYPFWVILEEGGCVLCSLDNSPKYKFMLLDELIEKVPSLKEHLPFILGKKSKNGCLSVQ